MTTAIVGQQQAWVASRTTDYTVTLPGDVPTEGWIICAISQSTISPTGVDFNISGWTAILAPTAINGRYQSLFAKKLTAGMSSFTITWPTTSTAARIAVVYGTGEGPETWTVGSAEQRKNYGSPPRTWCRAPSITAPGNGLVIMLAYEVTNALEATAPTVDNGFSVKSYQAQATASIDINSIWIGEKAVSAGAVGVTTVTWPNAQDLNGLGIQFFMPATAAPTTTGSGLSAIDGSGDEIKVFCTNDSGSIITPNALSILPLGYRSVDQMLEQPEFYWAHRGGSASYPEHSLWAYTQSVARGFGALECSLGRTSDGVWVGLHDADINRTSGLAAGTQPAISSMTWAQVQAFNITIGASGAPKPYMRIEELLDAYGNSHVLILDVKYAGSFIVELMNKLQTFYGSDAEANKHIIIKAYGVGSMSLRNTVNARGYKTWGYFYDTDVGNYVAEAPKWDILGLNYSCDQTYWNQLAAAGPGKRIVAHICPNESAVATGRSKGATGFQCSGVAVIKPKLAFEYNPA